MLILFGLLGLFDSMILFGDMFKIFLVDVLYGIIVML